MEYLLFNTTVNVHIVAQKNKSQISYIAILICLA